jgi:hypothetical protein
MPFWGCVDCKVANPQWLVSEGLYAEACSESEGGG